MKTFVRSGDHVLQLACQSRTAVFLNSVRLILIIVLVLFSATNKTWAEVGKPENGPSRIAPIGVRMVHMGHLPHLGNAGSIRAVFVSSKDKSSIVQVYEKLLIFPNKVRMNLDRHALPKPFEGGVVTAWNHENGTISYDVYNLDGKLLLRKPFAYAGSVYVTSIGSVVVSDGSEGYGEQFSLYSKDGRLIKTFRPYQYGFDLALFDSRGGRIIVYLKPDDPKKEFPMLLLINETDGSLLVDHQIDIDSASTIQLGINYIILHYTGSRNGQFISELAVFSASGQKIRTIESYAFHFVLDEANERIVICARDSVKRVNLQTGTIDWEKSYTNLYSGNRIASPNDIPAGFDLYPLALRHLSSKGVIALLMAQSSFNVSDPRYKGELLLLAEDTGKLIDRKVLADRNSSLQMEVSDNRIHLISDDGLDTYEVK